MSDTIYPVPSDFAAKANITPEIYRETYARSIKDPVGFWKTQSKRLKWMKAPTQIKDVSWNKEDLHVRWYACLLYTSPSPRDQRGSRMPSSA